MGHQQIAATFRVVLFACAMNWAAAAAGASIDRPTVYLSHPALSYAGSGEATQARFPNVLRYIEHRKQQAGGEDAAATYTAIREALGRVQPANFDLGYDRPSIAGNDQVVQLVLLLTNEIVSVEPVGPHFKLYVQLRGQALFFDVKAMRVLTTYPISFSYLDVKSSRPGEREIDENIDIVFRGAQGKPGLISRFADAVAAARFTIKVDTAFLQVTSARIDDAARGNIPAFLQGPGIAEEWFADLFAESISKELAIPILPFRKGDAIKKMQFRLQDGENYQLEIPQPNFTIATTLTSLKRIADKDTDAAQSFVYGSVANIVLSSSIEDKLNSKFRFGKHVVVPKVAGAAPQESTPPAEIDDGTSYRESVEGLLGNVSRAIKGEARDWVAKNALPAPNTKPISGQLADSLELLRRCK